MPKFKAHKVDGQPAFDRPAFEAALMKHDRSIIDVRKYDETAEISIQQMKYWHSMPIKLYAEHTGNSQWRSEQWLKRECGSQWFMLEVEQEETRRGQIMFECQNPECRQLFILPGKLRGKYVCPDCRSVNIRMFFMLSKTELSVNDMTQVLENMWDFMGSIKCECPPPDPNWRIKKGKELAKNARDKI